MMSPGMTFPAKRTAVEANLSATEDSLLPVRRHASQVAEFLNQKSASSVIIIISDTGSGKTTQIPQLLADPVFDGFFGGSRRKIAVTQPRRVAAVSVATRVAAEYGCPLGDEVGYAVRFDDCTSDKTKIKYMTDGMLVREAQMDWLLSDYNMVILDEVHERSLHTDILLAVVRKAAVRRKKFANAADKEGLDPLKILLMSATMDLERMQTFWKDAPVLLIPGKTFPVEVKFSPKPIDDYIYATMVAIFQIHRTEAPGDILVFLTGQEEIEEVVRRCRQIALALPVEEAGIRFVPLYASLPTEFQMRAVCVEKRDDGQRKVIVATNVAETSLTIPRVKFVLDCGRVKGKVFTAATGMEVLKVETLSQAQAWQRTGRAGREQPGICYRLYTETEFNSWPKHPIPEILRSNLATVLLQIIAMGMEKPLAFPFFDRPEEGNLRAALRQLEWLNALTQKEVNGDVVVQLTKEGHLMAKFPLDPRYSRCILRASQHHCTEEVLSIIAMLSGDSPFHAPLEKREEAGHAHEKFASNEGDLIVLLKIWRNFRQLKTQNAKREWCQSNFVSQRNMEQAEKTRKQLREICQKTNVFLSFTNGSATPIRRALSEGLFMNTAEILPDGSYITLDKKQAVFLHPSSFLFKTKPNCFVFNSLVKTTKLYVRDLCLVEKEWVDAVGKQYFVDMRREMAEGSSVQGSFSRQKTEGKGENGDAGTG